MAKGVKQQRNALTACVTCGLKAIKRKPVDVNLRSGKVVHGVMADVCGKCGEQYFDVEAMRAIESVAKS